MDFWHDAAAQKRWLRRFALLTGLLLVPVFVLAVFARPSADDYIYAARTHAVIQQYGFDLPRLLKARGTPMSTTIRTGRGCMSPALRWRFSLLSSATGFTASHCSVCCCRSFSACTGWCAV